MPAPARLRRALETNAEQSDGSLSPDTSSPPLSTSTAYRADSGNSLSHVLRRQAPGEDDRHGVFCVLAEGVPALAADRPIVRLPGPAQAINGARVEDHGIAEAAQVERGGNAVVVHDMNRLTTRQLGR
jgi:hypothetical protein